ncbi:MAG: hypothetical protein JWQ04_3229, partial [Pedosphaera sp.]|nr:hypothetical protein [Pedosphaera sp.]
MRKKADIGEKRRYANGFEAEGGTGEGLAYRFGEKL